jgi:ABC-type branched-subunit amino acid transport system substrate-binding protein
MRRITVAMSLALSGRYSTMGRQAEAALQVAADQFNAGPIDIGGEPASLELEIHDDRSSAARCAEIYREICAANRADIVLGPYASDLVRAVAPIADGASRLIVNHGGADDAIHSDGARFVVSVLSPASQYLQPFVRMLAGLKYWRKRLAIVSADSEFARAATDACESDCVAREVRRRGVRIRVKWRGRFDPTESPAILFPALRRNRVNALVSAGSFAHDISVMRSIVDHNLDIPVLGCVAAGVCGFREAIGDAAEGIVGVSQWDESTINAPELGMDCQSFVREMRARGFASVDYPGAQAYAAITIALAAAHVAGTCESSRMRERLDAMRTSTLFGDFAIDTGCGIQTAHKMIAIQWHGGRKIVIDPAPEGDSGDMDFPSGWHLMVAGLDILNLRRRGGGDEQPD